MLKVLFAVVSLSLCSFPLFGQVTPFLKERSTSTAGFTTKEQLAWTALAQSPKTLDIRLVEVGALPLYLSGDALDFHLPGTSDTVHVRGLHLENGKFKYTWWGEEADASGYFGMAADTIGKLVYVYHNGDTYMIHPLSKRYNAQVKMVPDSSLDVCVSNVQTDSTGPNCEIDTCKNMINALVLVTPEAVSEAVGFSPDAFYVTLYLALGQQTINLALLNSGAVGKSFRFVTLPYNFDYDQNHKILFDLNNFVSDSDVGDLVDTYRADMAILVTDTRYGDTLGIAHDQVAGALVTIEHFASRRFTFAHEIGHLLKADHNRISNGGDAADNQNRCNYGYRVASALGIIYTLMAKINEPTGGRIPYFSHPGISILNNPIGSQYSYNAAYITGNFCSLAGQFFEDDELKIDISGPSPVCNQENTYTIQIDAPGSGVPGSGFYTYKWYLGPSPYKNPLSGNLIGTTSSIAIDPYDFPYETFWIYASVHSDDGVFTTDVIEFENPCEFLRPAKRQILLPGDFFALSPNPACGFIDITFDKEQILSERTYLIYNAQGQQVKHGAIASGSDYTRIYFCLPVGIYTLQIRNGIAATSRKFTIQR